MTTRRRIPRIGSPVSGHPFELGPAALGFIAGLAAGFALALAR